jgi:plastocyanin
MRLAVIAAAAGCVLALAAGCKKPLIPGPTAHYEQIDLVTGATISGTVHISKKVPAPVEIDMAQDPACSLAGTNMSEQYVVNAGKLANVFVYVKDGLGNRLYPAPLATVTIDQKGCRFVPHVVAAMVGQQVSFINSDPTMHNIHMLPTVGGNDAFDVSEGPNGGPQTHVFHAPELMISIRCNNHPWMQGFLNIAPNPFFTVSDATGHYEIKGLPPGTYTLVADHEQLGQQTQTITVAAKQTAVEDFVYGDGK